jgi:hypothetical protein
MTESAAAGAAAERDSLIPTRTLQRLCPISSRGFSLYSPTPHAQTRVIRVPLPILLVQTTTAPRLAFSSRTAFVRCRNSSSMTDGSPWECERRSSSWDKWDFPKPIGSRVLGLPSSHYLRPALLLLLLLFLLTMTRALRDRRLLNKLPE